jgi:hypothetical protein
MAASNSAPILQHSVCVVRDILNWNLLGQLKKRYWLSELGVKRIVYPANEQLIQLTKYKAEDKTTILFDR